MVKIVLSLQLPAYCGCGMFRTLVTSICFDCGHIFSSCDVSVCCYERMKIMLVNTARREHM